MSVSEGVITYWIASYSNLNDALISSFMIVMRGMSSNPIAYTHPHSLHNYHYAPYL